MQLCRAVEQSGQPGQGRLGPRLEQWLKEGESDEEGEAAATVVPPSDAGVTATQGSRAFASGTDAVAPAAAPSSSAGSRDDSLKELSPNGSALTNSGNTDSPARVAEGSTRGGAVDSVVQSRGNTGQVADSAGSSRSGGRASPSSPDANHGSSLVRGINSTWQGSPRADPTSSSVGGPPAGVNGRGSPPPSPGAQVPGTTYAATDRRWQAPSGSGMQPPTGPRPAPVALIPADEDNASKEGHFIVKLVAGGMLDSTGQPTPWACYTPGSPTHTLLSININELITRSKRIDTILAVVRDCLHMFTAVNTITAMHRIGKMVRSSKRYDPQALKRVQAVPAYQALLEKIGNTLEEMSGRSLSNCLWGMAAAGEYRPDLVQAICQRMMQLREGDLQLQEIANAVYALGTLGIHLPEVMDWLLELAIPRLDEFIPQALSNLAIPRLEFIPQTLSNMAIPRLDEFIPQALSNMVWACGTLQHCHPRFNERLAEVSRQRLREFQPQTLTNMVWAFSNLGVYPEELFRAAAYEIVRKPESQPQQQQAAGPSTPAAAASSSSAPLAPPPAGSAGTTAGTAGPSSPSGHPPAWSVSDLGLYKDQELSNLLIAYARVNLAVPELLAAIEKEMCKPGRLSGFSSQALANTIWAFATLRWDPTGLYEPFTRALDSRLNVMAVQEMANTLWSYAKLGYHPGAVLGNLLRMVTSKAHLFPAQACTNSIWALAILQETRNPAFVRLLRRFNELEAQPVPAEDRSNPDGNHTQYNQVLQGVISAQLEGVPGTFREEVDLPDHVVVKAMECWQKMVRAGALRVVETRLSEFHLSVSGNLALLGVEQEVEHLTGGDLLSVDIAVHGPTGARIAVEVDGPFHYAINTMRALGPTIGRRRILRSAGWRVVSIPFFEWFPLNGKRPAQLRYLAGKLAQADAGLVPLLKANLQAVLRQQEPGTARPGSPEGGEGSEWEDAAALDSLQALPAALAAGSKAVEQDGAGKAAAPAVSFAYLRQLATRDDITLTKGAHRLLREWASYAGLQQLAPGQPAASQAAPAAAGSAAGVGSGSGSGREVPGALSDVEGLEGEWESVGPGQQQAPRAVSINSEDQHVLQKLISLGHVETQHDTKPRWTDFEGRRVVVESTSKPRQLQAQRPPPLFASGGRGGTPGAAAAAAAAAKLAGRTAAPGSAAAQKRFLKKGLAGDAVAPAERAAASPAVQQQWQQAQQQGRWGEGPGTRLATRDATGASDTADGAGGQGGGPLPPMPRPAILNPMARSAHPASPSAFPASPAGQGMGVPMAQRRGAPPVQQQPPASKPAAPLMRRLGSQTAMPSRAPTAAASRLPPLAASPQSPAQQLAPQQPDGMQPAAAVSPGRVSPGAARFAPSSTPPQAAQQQQQQGSPLETREALGGLAGGAAVQAGMGGEEAAAAVEPYSGMATPHAAAPHASTAAAAAAARSATSEGVVAPAEPRRRGRPRLTPGVVAEQRQGMGGERHAEQQRQQEELGQGSGATRHVARGPLGGAKGTPAAAPGAQLAAGSRGPLDPSAQQGRNLSSDEMLDSLQPLLERSGVDDHLLLAFEAGFAELAPSRQRWLLRALGRAARLDDRAAMEKLLRGAVLDSQ
ncbi:hypothetical protein N2152v2_010267 [Parachlorella kessleri]